MWDVIWIGYHSHCFIRCLITALTTSNSWIAGGVAAVWLPPGWCPCILSCARPCAYAEAVTTPPLVDSWHLYPSQTHTSKNLHCLQTLLLPLHLPSCAPCSISSTLFYTTLLRLFSSPEQKINILALMGSEQITWDHWFGNLFWFVSL